MLYLLTFGAGLVAGGLFVGAGMMATFRPALDVARVRAESAETERDILRLQLQRN